MHDLYSSSLAHVIRHFVIAMRVTCEASTVWGNDNAFNSCEKTW